MKLSDYVIARVAEAGVRHVFMLAGGGSMHLVDSLGRNGDLAYIANLHEQGAAIAAEAYGQYMGDLGVALVTTGPGGTNTLTGLVGAWLDSTPVLFVSGQVKRADMIGDSGLRQMGFQEADIVGIVTPVTKYAVTVTDPDTIAWHLDKALHIARSGRPGPVWVDVPLDVQAAQVDEGTLARYAPDEPVCADAAAVEKAVDETLALLATAERPVLLVGNGVRLAGAVPDVVGLAEALRLPVLLTWKMLDALEEDHPLYCGRPGSIGQRGANFTQQNADLLISVGARLDLGQTGYDHARFARGARKVIVDIDHAEIAKLKMDIDVPVVADAGAFVRALAARAGEVSPVAWEGWLARAKELQGRYPVMLPEYRDRADGVDTYALVDVISDALGPADMVVPGSSGSANEVTMQSFRVKRGQRVIATEGLGSMGFGIPAAIGACLASGGRRIVCIEGDGSFHMNVQELEVVRRLDLPVKFFVLDNGGYASIRASQANYFEGRLVGSDPASGLTLPDICEVAEAYRIRSMSIESRSTLREDVAEALAHPGPVVCRIATSPSTVTQPRLSSYARADGTMASRPLEDLWPFLDREEFRANMLVPPVEE